MSGPVEAALAWGAWAGLAAYLLGLALVLWGRPGPARGLALAGTLCCAGAVAALVWREGRPPLFGGFESLLELVLLLGALTVANARRPAPGAPPLALSLAACAGLLVLLLALPRQTAPDSFMFDYPWLLAFFQMRLLAQALLVHAALCFLGGWPRRATAGGRPALARGRWHLLAGWCAFMAGEFCGSLWSWLWLGDFWHWNAGFLESIALFLLIALPLHLPARLAASPLWPSLTGALAGVLTPLVILARQLWQV